jgi:ankyrin repeat protein
MAISVEKLSSTDIQKGLKALTKANANTQTATANKWLAACKNEPDKLAALQQCLKIFKISFEGMEEIEITSNPNPPSYYKEFYNDALYQQACAISALAYTFEKNGIVEEHATKLAVMFDDSEIMLNYLAEYAKGTQSSTPLHNACLFSLPDFQEPGFLDKNSGCKFEIFKKMAKSNMLRKDFKEMLPFAWELQKIVVEANQAKASEPKLDKYQIQEKNKLIKILSTQLQTDIATYEDLERRKNTLSDAEEEAYDQFAKKLSYEWLDLAQLCKGKLLKDLSVLELRAIYEEYKVNTSESYRIFLDNNIPEKFFAQFKALNRQGAGEFIPDVTIDGAALGHPGYYLMKVPVADEKHAARAACFGKMTDCCQSLSGEAGQSCVIHGLTSPYGGFYVLCKGDSQNPQVSDEVIGQSWTWRSQSNAIVLDSIEVAQSADKEMVKPFYDHLAKTLVEQHQVPKVACGASSGISEEVGVATPFNKEAFRDYQGYCDSTQQRVIVDRERPYYFYDKGNEDQEKTKAFILKALENDDVPSVQNKSLVEMLNWALFQNNPTLITVATELADDAHREELEQLVEVLQEFTSTDYHSSELLSMLAESGIYLEIRDWNNSTPLMLAAKYGHSYTCSQLIDEGADVNAKDNENNTPLMFAAEKGLTEVCLELMDNGADVNAKSLGGTTSLMLAAGSGLTEVCLEMIEKGATVNTKNDYDNTTPLMFAAESGLTEVCLKLIKKGADVNAKNDDCTTPLMFAAAKGHSDTCYSLIENGAKVNAQNTLGDTPLLLAAAQGHPDTCLSLIENEADLNAKNNVGDTPLMSAIKNRLTEICLLMIDEGVQVNAKNNIGDTPLMLAAKNRLTEVCYKLISKEAEVTEETLTYLKKIDNRRLIYTAEENISRKKRSSMMLAYKLSQQSSAPTKAETNHNDTSLKTDIPDPKPRNN